MIGSNFFWIQKSPNPPIQKQRPKGTSPLICRERIVSQTPNNFTTHWRLSWTFFFNRWIVVLTCVNRFLWFNTYSICWFNPYACPCVARPATSAAQLRFADPCNSLLENETHTKSWKSRSKRYMLILLVIQRSYGKGMSMVHLQMINPVQWPEVIKPPSEKRIKTTLLDHFHLPKKEASGNPPVVGGGAQIVSVVEQWPTFITYMTTLVGTW